MQDVKVSVCDAGAWTLWVIGLGLIIMGMTEEWGTDALGVFVAGSGGVLSVRGFFCRQHALELAAFELGKESIRRIR